MGKEKPITSISLPATGWGIWAKIVCKSGCAFYNGALLPCSKIPSHRDNHGTEDSMRRLAQTIRNFLRRSKKKSNTQPFRRRYRLNLETLEDRLAPATAGFTNTAPAVLTGRVYIDANNNNIFDSGEIVVP